MLTSAKISNRDGCISPPHVAHSLFHPQAGIHLCTMGMEHTAINFMSQQCSSVYSRKDKPVEAHGLLQELCVHPAPWQDNTLQKKNSMLLRPETTNELLSVHGCWSSHWGTEVSTFKQRAVQQAEAIETCADGSAIFPRFSFSRGFNRWKFLTAPYRQVPLYWVEQTLIRGLSLWLLNLYLYSTFLFDFHHAGWIHLESSIQYLLRFSL